MDKYNNPMSQLNNSLYNKMTMNVEHILPDTDFGRELIYKLSLSLNLPRSNARTRILEIKRLRPFKEIAVDPTATGKKIN